MAVWQRWLNASGCKPEVLNGATEVRILVLSPGFLSQLAEECGSNPHQSRFESEESYQRVWCKDCIPDF